MSDHTLQGKEGFSLGCALTFLCCSLVPLEGSPTPAAGKRPGLHPLRLPSSKSPLGSGKEAWLTLVF